MDDGACGNARHHAVIVDGRKLFYVGVARKKQWLAGADRQDFEQVLILQPAWILPSSDLINHDEISTRDAVPERSQTDRLITAGHQESMTLGVKVMLPQSSQWQVNEWIRRVVAYHEQRARLTAAWFPVQIDRPSMQSSSGLVEERP
jgi:hypothetical protein